MAGIKDRAATDVTAPSRINAFSRVRESVKPAAGTRSSRSPPRSSATVTSRLPEHFFDRMIFTHEPHGFPR